MEGTSRLLGSERGGSSIGSSGMHPWDHEPAFPGTALPLSGSERLWRGGGEETVGAVWLMSSSEQSSPCILPRPGECLVLISLGFPHNTEKAQETEPSRAFSDTDPVLSKQRIQLFTTKSLAPRSIRPVSDVPPVPPAMFPEPTVFPPPGMVPYGGLPEVLQMPLRELALRRAHGTPQPHSGHPL